MMEMSQSGWAIASCQWLRPRLVTQLRSKKCDKNSSEGLHQVLFFADRKKPNRNKKLRAAAGCSLIYLGCLELCNHRGIMKRRSGRISQCAEEVRAENGRN